MAEIEITLPTVQYGNVKVRATPEELGVELAAPHSVGQMTAVFLNLFTQGFQEGAKMDVSALVGASQGAVEEKAQELLNEGLGGVTEVPAGDVVAHESAPWDKPAVDAKPKPWEAGATAPKAVVTEGW